MIGGAAQASLRRSSLAAGSAALVLVAAAIVLATPGPGLVPGAGPDRPGWIVGPFGDGLGTSPGLFLAAFYLATIAWVVVWLNATSIRRRLVYGLIGALLALFTLAPPLLSLDIFSYLSYSRLAADGLDPYEFAPVDLGADDEIGSRVEDFSETPSVYGPVFTLLTRPLGGLGGGSGIWALKLLALASIAVVAALTARLARLRGVEPAEAAAFVALNPIVLVHLVAGAHNDGLMVAIALAGILAILTARTASGGAALVAAAATKSAGALYAPFALAGTSERGRLLTGFLAAGVATAAVALAWFGGSVTEALSVAGDNQQTISRWSVPGTLSRITTIDVDLIRPLFAIGYGILVLWLLRWVLRGADWVRASGWAAFGLLVATAWMVPWYLIWLLPIAAVARDRPLAVAAVGMSLFQTINSVPV